MDYKKHALENLTNWLHDCVSCEEMSSQEIYDTIKEVIVDNYKVYNNLATKCKDLMDMISVDNPDYFKYEMSMEDDLIKLGKFPATYDEMISAGYEITGDGFWCPKENQNMNIDPKGNYVETDQYYIPNLIENTDIIFSDNSPKLFNYPEKMWTVNIEKDSTNDEYFFTLPEELVEKLSWKEGDVVEYIDNKDGSFTIKKTVSQLST